jgi:hypothetical protein
MGPKKDKKSYKKIEKIQEKFILIFRRFSIIFINNGK